MTVTLQQQDFPSELFLPLLLRLVLSEDLFRYLGSVSKHSIDSWPSGGCFKFRMRGDCRCMHKGNGSGDASKHVQRASCCSSVMHAVPIYSVSFLHSDMVAAMSPGQVLAGRPKIALVT